jgi:hypothetical protein
VRQDMCFRTSLERAGVGEESGLIVAFIDFFCLQRQEAVDVTMATAMDQLRDAQEFPAMEA